MFGCVNRASDTLIDDLEKKDFYCRKICVSDELKRLYEVSFVEKCKKMCSAYRALLRHSVICLCLNFIFCWV